MPILRKLARQMLLGLDFLHRFCNLIHTDLKPENVLLKLNDEEIQEIQERTSKVEHIFTNIGHRCYNGSEKPKNNFSDELINMKRKQDNFSS